MFAFLLSNLFGMHYYNCSNKNFMQGGEGKEK
jgi:hypothetical protein